MGIALANAYSIKIFMRNDATSARVKLESHHHTLYIIYELAYTQRASRVCVCMCEPSNTARAKQMTY